MRRSRETLRTPLLDYPPAGEAADQDIEAVAIPMESPLSKILSSFHGRVPLDIEKFAVRREILETLLNSFTLSVDREFQGAIAQALEQPAADTGVLFNEIALDLVTTVNPTDIYDNTKMRAGHFYHAIRWYIDQCIRLFPDIKLTVVDQQVLIKQLAARYNIFIHECQPPRAGMTLQKQLEHYQKDIYRKKGILHSKSGKFSVFVDALQRMIDDINQRCFSSFGAAAGDDDQGRQAPSLQEIEALWRASSPLELMEQRRIPKATVHPVGDFSLREESHPVYLLTDEQLDEFTNLLNPETLANPRPRWWNDCCVFVQRYLLRIIRETKNDFVDRDQYREPLSRLLNFSVNFRRAIGITNGWTDDKIILVEGHERLRISTFRCAFPGPDMKMVSNKAEQIRIIASNVKQLIEGNLRQVVQTQIEAWGEPVEGQLLIIPLLLESLLSPIAYADTLGMTNPEDNNARMIERLRDALALLREQGYLTPDFSFPQSKIISIGEGAGQRQIQVNIKLHYENYAINETRHDYYLNGDLLHKPEDFDILFHDVALFLKRILPAECPEGTPVFQGNFSAQCDRLIGIARQLISHADERIIKQGYLLRHLINAVKAYGLTLQANKQNIYYRESEEGKFNIPLYLSALSTEIYGIIGLVAAFCKSSNDRRSAHSAQITLNIKSEFLQGVLPIAKPTSAEILPTEEGLIVTYFQSWHDALLNHQRALRSVGSGIFALKNALKILPALLIGERAVEYKTENKIADLIYVNKSKPRKTQASGLAEEGEVFNREEFRWPEQARQILGEILSKRIQSFLREHNFSIEQEAVIVNYFSETVDTGSPLTFVMLQMLGLKEEIDYPTLAMQCALARPIANLISALLYPKPAVSQMMVKHFHRQALLLHDRMPMLMEGDFNVPMPRDEVHVNIFIAEQLLTHSSSYLQGLLYALTRLFDNRIHPAIHAQTKRKAGCCGRRFFIELPQEKLSIEKQCQMSDILKELFHPLEAILKNQECSELHPSDISFYMKLIFFARKFSGTSEDLETRSKNILRLMLAKRLHGALEPSLGNEDYHRFFLEFKIRNWPLLGERSKQGLKIIGGLMLFQLLSTFVAAVFYDVDEQNGLLGELLADSRWLYLAGLLGSLAVTGWGRNEVSTLRQAAQGALSHAQSEGRISRRPAMFSVPQLRDEDAAGSALVVGHRA